MVVVGISIDTNLTLKSESINRNAVYIPLPGLGFTLDLFFNS